MYLKFFFCYYKITIKILKKYIEILNFKLRLNFNSKILIKNYFLYNTLYFTLLLLILIKEGIKKDINWIHIKLMKIFLSSICSYIYIYNHYCHLKNLINIKEMKFLFYQFYFFFIFIKETLRTNSVYILYTLYIL